MNAILIAALSGLAVGLVVGYAYPLVKLRSYLRTMKLEAEEEEMFFRAVNQ